MKQFAKSSLIKDRSGGRLAIITALIFSLILPFFYVPANAEDISGKATTIVSLDKIVENNGAQTVIYTKDEVGSKVVETDTTDFLLGYTFKVDPADAVPGNHIVIPLHTSAFTFASVSAPLKLRATDESGNSSETEEVMGNVSVYNGTATIEFTQDLSARQFVIGGFWVSGQLHSYDVAHTIGGAAITFKSKPGTGGGTGHEDGIAGNPTAFQATTVTEDLIKTGEFKNNILDFYFEIGYNDLRNSFRNISYTAKDGMVLIDELPSEWKLNNDLEIQDIFITVPVFGPQTLNENGAFAAQNEMSINKVGNNIRAFYKDYRAPYEKHFKYIAKTKAETDWESFKQEVLSRPTATVGVYDKSKLIIKFGTLKYGDVFNLEERIAEFKGFEKDRKINDSQAEILRRVYAADRDVLAYDLHITTKVNNRGSDANGKTYVNEAGLTWTGGFVTAQSNSVFVSWNGGGYISTGDIAHKYTTVKVSKLWDATVAEKDRRPVTVNLLADGNVKDTIELSKDNQWAGEFRDLAIFSGDREIVYTVREKELEGFTAAYSDAIYGMENGKPVISYMVTNSKQPVQQDKVDVEVFKEWRGNAENDVLPEVTIKLVADGVDTGRTLKLNKDNRWSGRFSDLDFKKDGREVIYTVKEQEIAGYKSTVELLEGKTHSYKVVNTKENYTGRIDIKVLKVWKGNTADEVLPKITVRLLADGADTGRTIELSKENNWGGEFTDLPPTKDGRLIDYTVQEIDKIIGYESKVEPVYVAGENGNTFAGYKITNTRKIPHVVEINVEKFWRGIEANSAPEVSFTLKADGVVIQTIKVNSSTNWKGSFGVFNKVNYETNKPIEYTVTEEGVDGYALVETKSHKGYKIVEGYATYTVWDMWYTNQKTEPGILIPPPVRPEVYIPTEYVPMITAAETVVINSDEEPAVEISDDDVAKANQEEAEKVEEFFSLDDEIPKSNINLPKTGEQIRYLLAIVAVISLTMLFAVKKKNVSNR